jgi:hypothetical protein
MIYFAHLDFKYRNGEKQEKIILFPCMAKYLEKYYLGFVGWIAHPTIKLFARLFY